MKKQKNRTFEQEKSANDYVSPKKSKWGTCCALHGDGREMGNRAERCGFYENPRLYSNSCPHPTHPPMICNQALAAVRKSDGKAESSKSDGKAYIRGSDFSLSDEDV